VLLMLEKTACPLMGPRYGLGVQHAITIIGRDTVIRTNVVFGPRHGAVSHSNPVPHPARVSHLEGCHVRPVVWQSSGPYALFVLRRPCRAVRGMWRIGKLCRSGKEARRSPKGPR